MEFRDESERLVAEQAVLGYRAVKRAASEAAFGDGMAAIERAALQSSRELGRCVIESMLASAASEKGPARARDAGGRRR